MVSLARRISSRKVIISSVVLMAAMATACASGDARRGPDEFRVVTKAPLKLPPEYNLRPPTPGEPTLADITPDDLAQTAYFGGITPQGSDAEQFLLARAGAAQAQPAVRALVDLEAAGLIRKEKSFTNRILFWRGADVVDGDNPDQTVDAETAESRAAATAAATGGDAVVMRRNVGPKLPGL